MIRVFLVDDQNIIREGVKTLLSQNNKIKIIGEAEDGETALPKIDILQPDVVLLDLNLPGIDGFNVAEKINYKFPHIQTIILSSNEQESYVKKAVSLGAKGYLSKNVSSEELESTIELVHQGYSVIKPELLNRPSVTTSYSKSAPATVSDDASPPKRDRSLDRHGLDSVQISQNLSPKPEPETKTNLDDVENLLIKNSLQQKYARHKRRRPNRLLSNSRWGRLKQTVTSFEFGLLVLIIIFSLSFLTAIALS